MDVSFCSRKLCYDRRFIGTITESNSHLFSSKLKRVLYEKIEDIGLNDNITEQKFKDHKIYNCQVCDVGTSTFFSMKKIKQLLLNTLPHCTNVYIVESSSTELVLELDSTTKVI